MFDGCDMRLARMVKAHEIWMTFFIYTNEIWISTKKKNEIWMTTMRKAKRLIYICDEKFEIRYMIEI